MKKLSSIQVVNILLFLALFVLFSVLYFFKETTELDKFSLPVLKPNFFKFYRNRLRKYEVKPHRRPTK